LGLALQNYHDTYKVFPAGCGRCAFASLTATTCDSWNAWGGIASLTAFVEQGAIFGKINWGVVWSNAAVGNSTLAATVIPSFLCPRDPPRGTVPGTSYLLCHGPVSTWNPPAGREPGIFNYNVYLSIAEVRDGTSNTIAMSEGRLGQAATGTTAQWDTTKRDPRFRVVVGSGLTGPNGQIFKNTAADMAAIKTYYQTCLGMYDAGSGWENQDDLQGRQWAACQSFTGSYCTTLVGPNAGPACDVDASTTVIDLREPSSYHPGGVQVLKADASVSFASDTIDQAIWIGAGSRAGGESVSLP